MAVLEFLQDRNERMNLVLGCSANTVLGLAVTVKSLLNKTSKPCMLYLFDLGISKKDKERLSKSWKSRNLTGLEFIKVDLKVLKDCRPTMYMKTVCPYFKYLLGTYLPKEVTRCLYLDSDLIVHSDISTLYYSKLEGHTIGAVRDPSVSPSNISFVTQQKQRFAILGIHQPTHYFNSGVILIDLKRWRDKKMTEKLFEHTKRYFSLIHAQDQDTLNGVFHSDWKEFDEIWNQSQYNKNLDITQGITHLIGFRKPWHADYDYKMKQPFFDLLDTTEFKGWRPWNFIGIGKLVKMIHRKIPTPGVILSKLSRLKLSKQENEPQDQNC